jgi:hypothetical protein
MQNFISPVIEDISESNWVISTDPIAMSRLGFYATSV